MKEFALSLQEVLNLSVELEGFVSPETRKVVVKGLINQELSLVGKYWVSKLLNTIKDEKSKIETLRTELVKKYGTEVDGNITIKVWTDDTQTATTPEYQEFSAELAKLLNEKVTIQFTPIKLSLLEKIDTTETYVTFFNFVDDTQ